MVKLLLSVVLKLGNMLRVVERISIRVQTKSLLIFALCMYLVPLQWIVAWLSAVMIHELGHCVLLYILGGRIVSFQISSFGCKIESTAVTDIQELFCIMAGPIFALSTLFFSCYIPRITLCALVQSFYNLLPIYPLDGGRLIRVLRKIRKTPCKQAPI